MVKVLSESVVNSEGVNELNAAPVVLFDGVCNLCSGAVKWILKHDKKEQFLFTSIQGEMGQKLIEIYRIPMDKESVILIENDKVYLESAAALRIAKACGGGWKMLWGFMVLPAFIRDGVYRFIARNRYRWFGRKAMCWLPEPRWKNRFI